MSLVLNEQTKLTATYLNGLAIAIFAVGGLASIVTNLYSGSLTGLPIWGIVLGSSVCWIVSIGLHVLGRSILRELQS